MVDHTKIIPLHKKFYSELVSAHGIFTQDQIEKISQGIKADQDIKLICVAKISAAARRLIISKRFHETSRSQGLEDLTELQKSALTLSKAISGLGVSARVALAENHVVQGGSFKNYESDYFLSEAITQIEEISLATRCAIPIAERKAGAGSVAKQAERSFYSTCRSAYVEAAGSNNGWRIFFRTITEALAGTLPPHLSGGEFDKWNRNWRKLGGVNNTPKIK